MLDDDDLDLEFDQKTPMQRFGFPVAGILFLLVCGASAYVLLRGGSGPGARPHSEPRITQVQLPPPPPPPPPKLPPPPPPKRPEVVPKQREATPQRAVSRPAPKAPTPRAAVTTSIAGPGPGSLAIGNDGGGGCIGDGCGTGNGGSDGDNDAYYSELMTRKLRDLLAADEKLRFSKYHVTLAFKLDGSGRVIEPVILSFSGDDDIRAEVERVVGSSNTGEKPTPSIVGKTFTVSIRERARG